MQKDLTQEWLNWIFENIQRGCDKNELLETLLKEGFNPSQAKIALGLDLSGNDLAEVKKFKEEKNEYLKTIPLGRWGTPEDVGNAVSYFSSDEASFITGQTLCVNGGRTPW